MRIRELDSLRGLASLGVVLFHYALTFDARPAAALLEPFYNYGFFLVDFFFVLSGFVLSHAYGAERKRGELKRNCIKRVARIYPLHLLTLLLALLLYVVFYHVLGNDGFFEQGNDLYHFVLNLTLTHRLGFQTHESFNIPSWSISTEFWVSIGFFVVIAAFRKTTPIFVALILFSFSLLFAADEQTLAIGQDLFFTDVCLMRNVLGFCIGAVLFRYCRGGGRSIAADIALVALVAGFLWMTTRGGVSMKTIFFVSACGLFPAIVAATLHARLLRALLNWKPLTFLGDISYSTYLIHMPLLLLLKGTIEALKLDVDYALPVMLLAYLVALIALSAACFSRFELPAQRWINERAAR